MITKELAELLTDEVLLMHFADVYGQTVFCTGNDGLKETLKILKDEILRRMKN